MESIALQGGRRLAYRLVGAASGSLVIGLHGLPGSSRHFDPFAAAASELGLRIAAPDRSGVGASDRMRGRSLADVAADVAVLADALGAARFAVLGYSFGAPYALACASLLPGRVTALGLVSGVGRLGSGGPSRELPRPLLVAAWLARRAPRLASTLLDEAVRRVTEPEAFVERVLPHVSPADRGLLTRPDVGDAIGGGAVDLASSSPGGLLDDIRAVALPWGVHPGEVRVPTTLWHGSDDHLVSPAVSRRAAGLIPAARLVTWPDEGHFAIYDHQREVLVTLSGPR